MSIIAWTHMNTLGLLLLKKEASKTSIEGALPFQSSIASFASTILRKTLKYPFQLKSALKRSSYKTKTPVGSDFPKKLRNKVFPDPIDFLKLIEEKIQNNEFGSTDVVFEMRNQEMVDLGKIIIREDRQPINTIMGRLFTCVHRLEFINYQSTDLANALANHLRLLCQRYGLEFTNTRMIPGGLSTL